MVFVASSAPQLAGFEMPNWLLTNNLCGRSSRNGPFVPAVWGTNSLFLCGVLLVSGRTNRPRHMRNAILHVLETGCQRRGFAEGLRDPPHPAATARTLARC